MDSTRKVPITLLPPGETMGKENQSRIVEVYGNIPRHQHIAELIRKRSTNKDDIRDVALEEINFKAISSILDLGCGFGFFTEALAGKISPRTTITGVDLIPGHEPLFLQACRHAGVQGHFIPGHASLIATFEDRSYDLVVCSYALYFFPEIVPHIARILKPGGLFVTITHDSRNMGDLFECIKKIMDRHYARKKFLLPVEKVIRQFSAENGAAVLRSWFGQVDTIDYPNTLVYPLSDLHEIIDYFHFKSPFFLVGTQIEKADIVDHLPELLRQHSPHKNGVVISKNDRIFICAEPKANMEEP